MTFWYISDDQPRLLSFETARESGLTDLWQVMSQIEREI